MKKRYITKLPDGRKKQYAILLGRRKLLTHGKIVEDSLLTKIYRSYFIPENFVEEEEPPANNMNGGIVNGAVGVKSEGSAVDGIKDVVEISKGLELEEAIKTTRF